MRCIATASLTGALPGFSAGENPSWRGRDGVVELPDGRLVAVIRGNIVCARERELDWVVSREQLALRLNAGVEDPDALVTPEYASAPTLLPSGLLCVAIQGGVAALSMRGELIGAAQVAMVDDTGDSPNFDQQGNALLTTIGGELIRWDTASTATDEVRTDLGYDLPCPAILPDGRMLLSCYCAAGLSLLNPSGQTLWEGVLDDADLVPTYSHGGLCLGGSVNEESSLAVSSDGVKLWTFPEAAKFASHPGGILIAASASALTALNETGEPLWGFRLPASESLPLGHFVCEDSAVVCATRRTCFAIAPPGRLLWSLDFDQITSAPIPLSNGSVAFAADGRLVIASGSR